MSAGRITPASTSATLFTDAGIVFNVTQSFTLNSVDVFPNNTSPTTFSISLVNSGGTTLNTSAAQTAPVGTGATPFTVNLGWSIAPGTAYRLVISGSASGNLVREFSPFTPDYPYPIGTSGSMTGGWLSGASTTYYFFYNWQVFQGCQSARTPVTATILTSPSISVTAGTTSLCAGNSTTVSVSSSNDPNYTYSWTSSPSGFVASGSGPLTVSPSVATTYSVHAQDNTTGTFSGCGAAGSISITPTVNNITLAPSAIPSGVCIGGTSQLNANATLSNPFTYCVPLQAGGSCITNVQFNTLNSSPVACVSPFYTINAGGGSNGTNVNPGSSYLLTITTANDLAGIVSVWIDFNRNGSFDATEWFQPYTNAFSGSLSILIPAGAATGPTGMRIRSRNNGSSNGPADACTQFFSGSTEDYSITIGNVGGLTYQWSPPTFLNNTSIADPQATK